MTLGFQFDVAEDDSDPVDQKHYNFVFDLKDLLNVRRKGSTFIQLDLFDASSTMTFMLFRGSAVLPLTQVPDVESVDDLAHKQDCHLRHVFTPMPALPTLPDESTIGSESLAELAQRKDDVSKGFVDYDEKCRKEKRIVMVPSNSDWASWSGPRSCSPCLFLHSPKAKKSPKPHA